MAAKSINHVAIIILNFIISVFLIIFGSVYYVLIEKHHDLIVYDFNHASGVMISMGVIIFVTSWIMFRFMQENMKSAVLMCGMGWLILYVILLVVGAYEYVRVTDDELNSRFIQKVFSYSFLNGDINTDFYEVQSQYHCCGVHDVTDYENVTQLPASCCYECYDCSEKFCSNNIDHWTEGCGNIMYDFTVNYVTATSITAMTMASIGIVNVMAIPFWVEKMFT